MNRIIFLCFFAAILVGCKGKEEAQAEPQRQMHVAKRAMYHWKNTFDLSDEEIAFINKHYIERLYIRFFDVTMEDLLDGHAPQAVPTASVRIKDFGWFQNNIGHQLEIVPTIFITPEAIGDINDKEQNRTVAQKMLERINNMCSYYEIPKDNVKEIQLDCDWTAYTEQAFFDFCKAVRDEMPDTILLSSTIRLHQLHRPEPPVDYGVLMLYNTNNLRSPYVKNSILSYNDVKPFLRNVKYELPLDLAFPTFSWDLWFKNATFQGIIRSESQADSLRQEGELVRHEEVKFDEIMRVKKLVEESLPKAKHGRSYILYHLDEENLKRYASNEIEIIYSH